MLQPDDRGRRAGHRGRRRHAGGARLRRGRAGRGAPVRVRARRDRRQAGADPDPLPVRLRASTREARTTADLAGVVRNRETKKPLAGDHLDRGRQDSRPPAADGRFALRRAAAGQASPSRSRAARRSRRCGRGDARGRQADRRRLRRHARRTKDDGDKRRPRDRRGRAAADEGDRLRRHRGRAGRRVPGTQGDVLKVVESMPGVARVGGGLGAAGGLGRGAAGHARLRRRRADPALYHAGGLRSVVRGRLVRSIELVPGGYGAALRPRPRRHHRGRQRAAGGDGRPRRVADGRARQRRDAAGRADPEAVGGARAARQLPRSIVRPGRARRRGRHLPHPALPRRADPARLPVARRGPRRGGGARLRGRDRPHRRRRAIPASRSATTATRRSSASGPATARSTASAGRRTSSPTTGRTTLRSSTSSAGR